MVVLAASICTKSGKPIISRQFREMPRSRIESLLTSFPKLIPVNSQHTSVETPDVRYVYQPLEDLYILLITNKASNILQDIDTLHLFARVVSDMCRSAEEKEIYRNSFELLGAFDEIVSLGYREQVNLMQIRSVLEMESHEEKIQEIIARNKEAEAKEELKRRAKQMEMQRREQTRRQQGGMSSNIGGGMSGYSSIPRFDIPVQEVSRAAPTTTVSATKAPAFKGSGMKLGKKTKQGDLLDALVNCWPTPTGDGTTEVNIEYELESDKLTLHDLTITIPLPDGFPTVGTHTGSYHIDSTSNALVWTVPLVSPSQAKSGSMEFTIEGEDTSAFFPVKVDFAAEGSLVGVGVDRVLRSDGEEEVIFSQDATCITEEYTIV
ncbi:hypothetical protein FRB99_005330 [Tulasnella sp. 403]|nr:hypothetical protein FRB99_005330 [Tulasnella sp. 403]